ncbi:hypothetical protein LXL04_008899 [Taraxacum kok-saghyz]
MVKERRCGGVEGVNGAKADKKLKEEWNVLDEVINWSGDKLEQPKVDQERKNGQTNVAAGKRFGNFNRLKKNRKQRENKVRVKFQSAEREQRRRVNKPKVEERRLKVKKGEVGSNENKLLKREYENKRGALINSGDIFIHNEIRIFHIHIKRTTTYRSHRTTVRTIAPPPQAPSAPEPPPVLPSPEPPNRRLFTIFKYVDRHLPPSTLVSRQKPLLSSSHFLEPPSSAFTLSKPPLFLPDLKQNVPDLKQKTDLKQNVTRSEAKNGSGVKKSIASVYDQADSFPFLLLEIPATKRGKWGDKHKA